MFESWEQPRARGPLGRLANVFGRWMERVGSVVRLLVWTNIILLVVELIFVALRLPQFDRLFALSGPQVMRGFVWQPFTYVFLHNTGRAVSIFFFDGVPEGLVLLVLDLFILWALGREIENFIGSGPFFRLYVLSGMTGGLLWLVFNLRWWGYAIGAPVAALGCIAAYGTLFPERELTLILIFIPVQLKAKYIAWIAAGLAVLPLVLYGVTNVSYIAGMAFGYLYIKWLGHGATPRWLLWLQDMKGRLKPRGRSARGQSSEDFMREEIDPILDKIAREGMQSLTRRERKLLESAKSLMQKRR